MFALIRIKQLELRIKLFVFCVLSIILYSLFFIHTVHAASSTPSASPSALPVTNSVSSTIPYTLNPIPSSVSPTSPLYTDLFVHNMFHSFSCLAIGQSVIGQPCLSYQITKNAQGMLEGVPVLSQSNLSGGALGATTSLIGAMYQNPPVRTADYLASVGQGLGIVREANAQVIGSGEAVLHPILGLWQVSRNIAYILIIIIFLVIGLMVMFRNRINPQTVITAQAALPGLIIGLVMITFSYFFAGLISDMAFLGTNIVGYYFQTAQGNSPQSLAEDVSEKSILQVFGNVIPDDRFPGQNNSNISYITHALQIIQENAPASVVDFMRFAAGVMAFQYGNQIGHIVPVVGDLAGIVGGVAAFGIAAADFPRIGGLLLGWVAMAILIYSMFKLLFNLIKAYLNIVFLTITAPFQFLAASLPGRQGLATGWILNMLAHVLAFPAVLAVLYFVAYLLKLNRPPLVISGQAIITGQKTFPLLGGLDAGFINYLVAFAALTLLPAIPEVINRSIGRASAAGQLLGQEVSANISGGRGYSNQWNQAAAGIQKIGQDYTTYRGRPPGWSPAGDAENSGWVQGLPFGIGRRITTGRFSPRPYEAPRTPGGGKNA